MFQSTEKYFSFKNFKTILSHFLLAFLLSFGSGLLFLFIFEDQSYPYLKDTVYYHDKSDYQFSVQQAVKKWNETGVVKFIKVKDASQADLVIDSSDSKLQEYITNKKDKPENMKVAALTYYNKKENKNKKELIVLPQHQGLDYGQEFITMLHELGHTIGLKHQNKCSVMYYINILDNICDNHLKEAQLNYKNKVIICGPLKEDLENYLKLNSKAKVNKSYSPYCFI